ncbi:MBL fold metallo-hydrolase, partial [candidate division KSB1 bacterium]
MKIILLAFLMFSLIIIKSLPEANNDPGITVTKLTDRIYKLTDDRGSYTVNMAVSVGEDGVLLVDTGYKDKAEMLMMTIQQIANGIPEIVINTHAHVDHTGGNELFGNTAAIIGHSVLRKRLQNMDYVLDEFPDHALPDITFDDSMFLYFNGEEIRLIALPGSHDDNDIIVHFTKSKVVCMGDLSYGMHYPTVEELTGNSLKYAEIVKKAIAILPEDVTIISGHGRDCTIEDLKDFQNMLETTTDIVLNELAKGKDYETICEENVLKDWNTYEKSFFTAEKWIEYLVYDYENIDKKPKRSLIQKLYGLLKSKDINSAIKEYYYIRDNLADEYFNPFVPDELWKIANKLHEKERFGDAIRFYKLCSEEFPDWELAWYNFYGLGQIYDRLNNKDLAIKALEKSLELNPD